MNRRIFLSRLAALPVVGRFFKVPAAPLPGPIQTTEPFKYSFSVVMLPVKSTLFSPGAFALNEQIVRQTEKMVCLHDEDVQTVYKATHKDGKWEVVNKLQDASVVKPESAEGSGREPESLGSASLPAGTKFTKAEC